MNAAKPHCPHTQKGEIKVGADADFVVWEPDTPVAVSAATIHSRHKVRVCLVFVSCASYRVVSFSCRASPRKQVNVNEGRAMKGHVTATFVRGQLVYSNGSFHEAAIGNVLRPELLEVPVA